MGDRIYYLSCGDFMLRYSFVYPETQRFFGEYLEKIAENECDCDNRRSPDCGGSLVPDRDNNSLAQDYDIRLTPKSIEEYRWLVAEEEESIGFMEFQALMITTGNFLLTHWRALFHGAAFVWNDRAWILTAPSGTGKTTQLWHWRNLQIKDFKIINGDKPLIECRRDGSVWIHSSPWRGKEKYGRKGLNAPLGGIILLEQGNENLIERMSPEDAVLPLFAEFVSFPENEEQIKAQAQILQQILDTVPVWKLTNLGDEESAILTQRTITNYMEYGS